MNYKKAVEEKIQEEFLKNLWEEITTAYEQGGEDEIKKKLSEKASLIISNFEKLLKKLEQKL